MKALDLKSLSLRQVNSTLQGASHRTNWTVKNPMGRHALAVGLNNDVNVIIEKTAQTQMSWSGIELVSRLDYVKNLAYVLKKRAKELSILMADEMGKPKRQGIGEISKCAWLCDYYLKNSEQVLSDKHVKTEFYESFVTYQPIGLILGIMPWNFPFWQVFRYAIPSLIVGNGVLLKHASNVQGCANVVKDCFIKAGFPNDILIIYKFQVHLFQKL